jgi:hypothetical protein
MCTYLTVSAAWAFNDPDFARYPGVGYHQRPKPGTLARWRISAPSSRFPIPRRLKTRRAHSSAPRFARLIRQSTRINSETMPARPPGFGWIASHASGPRHLQSLARIRPTAFAKPRAHPAHGTDLLGDPIVGRWSNQTDAGQNNLSPGEDRWLERSATYPGIAAAMGAQWGAYLTRAC